MQGERHQIQINAIEVAQVSSQLGLIVIGDFGHGIELVFNGHVHDESQNDDSHDHLQVTVVLQSGNDVAELEFRFVGFGGARTGKRHAFLYRDQQERAVGQRHHGSARQKQVAGPDDLYGLSRKRPAKCGSQYGAHPQQPIQSLGLAGIEHVGGHQPAL